MAPREDLISSAVTFLQDPSVAASPVQKRIEFLQSKNLTQEEVDLALTRAADDSQQSVQYAPQNQAYAQQQPIYNRGSAPRYSPYGNPYGPYGDWQPPPPELPRRDWRDWFIMATVTGGAAYGLYVLTKRYISPLISPPTPPQLEADKAAIDEQFNRAFALIETLSADTATLKAAEETRTERLDRALEEVESVVSELKAATRRREDDVRRLNDELRGLKEGIPKALEGHRESGDRRLAEVGNELRSLKALMGSRFSGSSSSQNTSSNQIQQQLPNGTSSTPTTTATPEVSSAATTTTKQQPLGPNIPSSPSSATLPPYGSISSAPSYQFPGQQQQTFQSQTGSNTSAASRQSSSVAGSGSGSGSGKAAIPAWQMAAANRKMGGGSGNTSVPGSGAGTVEPKPVESS